METYSWLVYSKEVDSAFCIWCIVFGHRFQALSKNSSKLEQLYCEPFWSWQQATSKLQAHHTNSHLHKYAALEYNDLVQLIQNGCRCVDLMINTAHARAVEANCAKLRQLSKFLSLSVYSVT